MNQKESTQNNQSAGMDHAVVRTRFATGLICDCAGDLPCFYCGNLASEPLKLSSAFMGWTEVAHPKSRHICKGCVWALDQKREMVGRDKRQKTQSYSWLITASDQVPLTKANKQELLSTMLTPPNPPWALAIAASGQKHLLYRTPVNREVGTRYVVQLELETIDYNPLELGDRYDLAKRVVAVIGHKGAINPSINLALSGSVKLAEKWKRVLHEPLTRLALFVCPSMEICKSEYQNA